MVPTFDQNQIFWLIVVVVPIHVMDMEALVNHPDKPLPISIRVSLKPCVMVAL